MNKKCIKVDRLITSIFVFLLLLYIVVKLINRFTYPGLVFSKIHIQPDSFKWPVIVFLIPVIVVWIPRINYRRLMNIKTVISIFILLIIFQNLFLIYKSKWQSYQFIATHPLANYEDRMRKVIGEFSYNYAMFVIKHTPDDATLLVPPQAFPWPSSGNIGYFRYFSYPRKLEGGDEFIPPTKEVFQRIDYVLLNWGETERVEDEHTHEWPKFDVKAEKIIFMNEDGSYGGEINGNYNYKDFKGKKVWGLIVVKH